MGRKGKRAAIQSCQTGANKKVTNLTYEKEAKQNL